MHDHLTLIPGRSDRRTKAESASILILTGTRCTTFTKLPVALSGGSRENLAPVAPANDSIVPWNVLSGIGIGRDIYFLAYPQMLHLGFLEIGRDIDALIIHDGKQGLTCLHQLTELDIPFRHDPVGRGGDHGIGQLQFGKVDIGLAA